MPTSEETKIRALIADDEPLARKRLRSLLQREPDIVVRCEAGNGLETLDAISAGGIDVVFLDINMPGLNGFEVLDSLPTPDLPHIVFVTAYHEHAVRAFDANAIDYLIKPFENERFLATLQKLRKADPSEVWHGRMAAVRKDFGGFATRIAVRNRGVHELVSISDIRWVDTQKNYLRLHLLDRVRLLRGTMSELENRLDPGMFVRIHRSTLVNIDRIRTIQPYNISEFLVTLDDGTALRSSRSYRARVAALIR